MVSPYFLVFALFLSIFALTVNVQEVKGAAFPIPDHVGILLSDTCITMHENNFTTPCPTYEQLLQVFEDTSNHLVSGGFEYNEHGFYERQKPIMKDHLRFYTFEEKLIQWIDPPADFLLGGHKRIIIAANPFEYKILDQTITNASHYVGNNRYVSSTCNYAIVSAEYWLEWVGDSLYYLLNDCDPEFTRYNATSLEKWEGTQHDITTSNKYKLEKWQLEAKTKCKLIKCNYDNSLNPPFKKQEKEIESIHYKIELKETLRFTEGSTNQANITQTEINPCKKDPKSLLCKVWEYKNKEHEINQSSYMKFRNAVAGAIGE